MNFLTSLSRFFGIASLFGGDEQNSLPRRKLYKDDDKLSINVEALHEIVSHIAMPQLYSNDTLPGAIKWDQLSLVFGATIPFLRDYKNGLDSNKDLYETRDAINVVSCALFTQENGVCKIEVGALKRLYENRPILYRAREVCDTEARKDLSKVHVLSFNGVPAREFKILPDASRKLEDLGQFMRKFSDFMEKEILPKVDPDYKPHVSISVGMPRSGRNLRQQ